MARSTNRKIAAWIIVGLFLATDLALSHGGGPTGSSVDSSTVTHGDLAAIEPPSFHRSKTFPRLGTIALNLTPCLHDSSPRMLTGFTCEHDLYSAYVGAHGNGDHWGNAYQQFNQYFADKFAQESERYLHMGISGPTELRDVYLKTHGASEPLVKALCGGWKPLQSTFEGPEVLREIPFEVASNWKSLCRFAPFYEPAPWSQAEVHDGDAHEAYHDGAAYPDLGEDVSDAMGVQHAGHAHSGPHGLDFNTETNWLYVGLSHQQKVAIVNLNVIDWGKVATWEEETGFRVILFDDPSVFRAESILYYASDLLLKARGDEERLIGSLDAIHRYCFDAQAEHLGGPQPWSDRHQVPSHLDPRLANAIEFVRGLTDPPKLAPGTTPPYTTGWACFLAFTGIDARPWTDPQFTNPFCTFDTRHLARYDHLHSPGKYSRANPNRVGDGDAWRCDWFTRYMEVTMDVSLTVRRKAPDIGVPSDVPLAQDHADMVEDALFAAEPPLPPTGVVDVSDEYVQFDVNVSVGPHDVVYNPVNGLVYVTHYWQVNDPDVRLLADWYIHALDGNPASPSFHNPYDTRGGPPELSRHGSPGGSYIVDDEAFPIDVGGPVDGLHPTTVDVDVRTGRVFVVNRESNTISVLYHDGSHDFTKNRLEATLKGPEKFAITMTPSSFESDARDFSLYRDPASMGLPTPEQVQGMFRVDASATSTDCAAFAGFALQDANTSFAKQLCEMGFLGALGLDVESARAMMAPEVEAIARRLLSDETPWDDLLADARGLADVSPESFALAAQGVRDEWLPRLGSEADKAFLDGELRALERVPAVERPRAVADFFARLEARLPGRLQEFVDDVLSVADELPGLDADAGAVRVALESLQAEWTDAARSGELAGFPGVGVEIGRVFAQVRAVEPIVSASFLTGTPSWLAYCVAYSADDWLYHFLIEGQDPWDSRGKEADNGRHPFHCDDVDKIHYPDPTPIQADYVGKSNHHHVVIVREPIGALLLDYWWEARPRLLQPFDLWINAGDGNIYVSNLGNHDNVPLVRGWIALIQEGGSTPCHESDPSYGQQIWPGLRSLAGVKDVPVKASCLVPAPNTGFQSNLMLDMDLMPHHLNVNPYTFEVYGGHLLSDYVMAGQFERERISWTIPKAHVAGSDTVPGSSLVPFPNPTGMAVNPSSQRVFATHFQDTKEHFVPLTGRTEDMTRYTSILDIRNYTLVNDLVYAGDHHAVADQTRPPGFKSYDDPFYNRTREINVSGRAVLGSPVLVGDSGSSLTTFHRCTYYFAIVKVDKEILGLAPTTDGGHALLRKPLHTLSPEEVASLANVSDNATASVLSPFDSGRCFNLFDLGTQMENWTSVGIQPGHAHGDRTMLISPPFTANIGEGPLLNLTMVAEFGEEYLTYGFLNLFFDPDNVPPTLRVESPRMRDTDRFVDASLRATEELAAAWLEADTPARAQVPRGDLVMSTPAPAGKGPWRLQFDTSYAVEWNGPARPKDPDRMTVALNGVEVGNWSARFPCCPTWRETRIPIAPQDWDNSTLAFAFDSVDGVANGHQGWTLAGIRIENATTSVAYDLSDLPNFTASGLVANVSALVPDEEDPVPAIAFRDARSGTYQVPQGRAVGAFSFRLGAEGLANITEPMLVLLHQQDVEPKDHLARSDKPYDRMQVEVSVDGGLTWRTAWSRDSRSPPVLDGERQSIDVTPLVEYASAQWARDNREAWEERGYAIPDDLLSVRPIQVRFRFDALDPAFNALPGWAVANARIVGPSGAADLQASGVPWQAGREPAWWFDGAAYRFQNLLGTYESPGPGAGGASGLACRLDHGWFGQWSGGLFRGPGSGALTFRARDLAGNDVELTHTDGRGVVLVEDSFENRGWTESYWRREETDPAGVGFPAYVLDPTPDGMGDLMPEDAPVRFDDGRVSAYLKPGVGEVLAAPRGVLLEGPPLNLIAEVDPPLLTETAALFTDGPEYRRAFVVTASDSDMERVSADLRAILEREGLWLNATHVKLLDEPEPVLVTIDQLTGFVQALLGQEHGAQLDLQAIIKELLETVRLAAHGRQWGIREAPPQEYILDGTEDVPVVAGERLSHTFRYARDQTEPVAADFSFDFVARHRFEGYPVWVKPFWLRGLLNETVDEELLQWAIHNVTLDKVRFTQGQVEALAGPIPVLTDVLNDAAWLSNHTLADLGVTADQLLDLLLDTAEDALALQVPVSEILNDQERLQMSLPSFGEQYAVTVKLVNTTGDPIVLAQRDGLGLSTSPVDVKPGEIRGDVRISLEPDAGTRSVRARVGMDVGRFEKLRVHLNATEANAVLNATGNYTLVVETTIRSADAPAPGLVHEVVYGDLLLNVTTREKAAHKGAANEAPDPAFAWEGPVAPGARVSLVPGFLTPAVGNAQDQDGYVRHYRWSFPAAGVASLALDGAALALDSNDSALDDLLTNVLATGYGKRAQNLTLRQAGGDLVLEYSAHGCVTPVPAVAFRSAGDFPVTLTVRDDDGAESSLAQVVRIGGGNRAPEFVIDPVLAPDGTTRIAWQNNTGSLFLEARGRSIRLVDILKNGTWNLTDLAKADPKNLTVAINFSKTQDLTASVVENGTREARALINATLRDPGSIPDIIDELLLIRPGIVRAVTTQPQDAADGARMQIHLGKAPQPAAVSVPALGILLGQEPSLASAAEVGRFARNGGQVASVNLSAVNQTLLCDPQQVQEDIGMCLPELEDIEKLLLEGVLDAWTFRYAIHPDVNGVADLNRTIAQVTVMDTGVGVVYFVTLDAIDKVLRLEQDLLGVTQRSLDNITKRVDNVAPVSPYLAVATALQREAQVLADRVLDRATIHETLDLSDDVPYPDVEGIEIVRGLTAERFAARNGTLDQIDALISQAQAKVDQHAGELTGAVADENARVRAEADLWAANAFTDVSLEPARGGRLRLAANATADFDEARNVSAEANEAARRALRELRNATNETTIWAQNWTDTLARHDREELLERVNSTRDNVTAISREVLDLAQQIYRLLRAPLFETLNGSADVEAALMLDPNDLPITLAYDDSTGEAVARAGDFVLARGPVSPENRSDKIHASLTFSSVAKRKIEVQALWGGQGSALYDGFNRDAPSLPGDKFDVALLGKNNTTASATTKVVAHPQGTAQEYVWLTRSAEGPASAYYHATGGLGCGQTAKLLGGAVRSLGDALLTTLGLEGLSDSLFGAIDKNAPGGFFNRHRFASDPRASPPGTCAAEMLETHASTREAGMSKAQLAALASGVDAAMDQPFGYTANVTLAPGALQEFRVADGTQLAKHRSAPAVHAPRGPPPAPFVFDARSHRLPGENESVQVAFQPVGVANPRVVRYEVFTAPRPNVPASEAKHLGQVDLDGPQIILDPPPKQDADWREGHDYLTFETTFSPQDREWRYIVVRAVNKDGVPGPFSTPYRVPPLLLEEDFALFPVGTLENGTGYSVDFKPGDVDLGLGDVARLKLDTCLGDRVEVTRYTSFPHDEDAARWSRSLRVQERGLDSLFWLLRTLNATLSHLPLDLAILDRPLVEVDWDECPSLRSLIEDVNGLTDIGPLVNQTNMTVLKALKVASNPQAPPLSPTAPSEATDLRLLHAVSNLTKQVLGNVSLNLSLKEPLRGAPAQVTWRVENASGPYYARTRFMLPGPQVEPLSASTPLDRLLPSLNLGLFSAVLPGERFHLLQLGHVDEKGNFTEVARVDLDPHLLAPFDVEGTSAFIDSTLALERDPLGSLVTGDLPLSYGIAAGDTLTNREIIAQAKLDHWHTIEVYVPDATSDVYAVSFDGKWSAQLRTSNRNLTANAIRVGGSNAPTEVLFDDVRLMDAIHPPVPVVTAVKAAENSDFATVRWHMPEDGGAPLSDFNLYRVDLDDPAAPAQIVATAGAGYVRFLSDPDSHGQPVGKRFAYGVQAVNEANHVGDARRRVGDVSDLRGVTLPGFLRVSADAAIAHNHQVDVADREGFEGQVALSAGGLGRTTWRSVFQVNASQATDAKGRALNASELGAATFMAYALDTDEASDAPFHILPTLKDVLMTLGYSEDLVAAANGATTIHSVEEAMSHLDAVAPGAGDYVRTNYGEGAYYEMLERFVDTTRVNVITCPDVVPRLLGHGFECRPATPEALVMTSMCDDASRDLEIREIPFNCWEDSVSAFTSPTTDFDAKQLTWANQPRTEYWRQDTGIARQHTHDEAWRRYDVLPALQRDGDADLTVVLKKEKDHAPSAHVFYAGVEAGSWVDDAVGPQGEGPRAPVLPWADRSGPDTFPWSSERASSGDRAVKLEGKGGVSSVKFAPSGVVTVPFDVPIKMDVFIPEGESPREIGMRVRASVVTRSELTAGRSCSAVYGGGPGDALVTWGDELVILQDGALRLDDDGELDYGADLSTPRENFTGLHVGGVPTQRGRWVTLTFDPGQLALELRTQKMREQRALLDEVLQRVANLKPGEDPLQVLGLAKTADVLSLLARLRGPDTSLWLPEHLANAAAIYERTHPTAFEERVDHVAKRPRDLVDYVYLIVPWKFAGQDFDKYVEPWQCGLGVSSIEVFTVGGDAFVDRIGPDIEPRVRIDAGGGRP